MNKIINNYNKIVKIMNDLLAKGCDIEAHTDHFRGYGFYYDINDKYFIHCYISENGYYLEKTKKQHPNILMGKTTKELRTTKSEDVKKFCLDFGK